MPVSATGIAPKKPDYRGFFTGTNFDPQNDPLHNFISDSELLSGSEGGLETETLSTLTPEQQALLQQMIEQLGGGADLAGGNFLSEAENTSLAGLEERAMLRATGGIEQESNEALMELISGRGSPGDFTDFFETNVRDPAVRDFRENIQPGISRQFGGSSFFGSERAKADRDASDDLISSLTQSRSKLAFDERTAASDRLMKAIGLAPQLDAINTDTRARELDALGTNRRARNDRVTQLLQLLNTTGVENLGGMTSGKTGLIQSFLGGGGGGALAGLLSDRRGKRNVVKIGSMPSGLNIYEFEYVGEKGMHTGLMADEVEEVFPDAVTTIRGVKYVDYTKVM